MPPSVILGDVLRDQPRDGAVVAAGWSRFPYAYGLVCASQCSSALPFTTRHMSNQVVV